MHILYVHWSGYLIFKVKEFEEIGSLILSVRKSYNDIKTFSGLVKLQVFYPFSDPNEAFDIWKYITSENAVPPSMKKFIHKYGTKNLKELGIEYTNLVDDFKKTLGITAVTHAAIMEIIRAIKLHIPTILKNDRPPTVDKLFLKAVTHKVLDGDVLSATSGINITNHYNLLMDMQKTINLKTTKLRQLIRPFYPELRLNSLLSDKDLPTFLSIYFNDDEDNTIDQWSQCRDALGDEKTNNLKATITATIGREICTLDKELIRDCSVDLLNIIERYTFFQKVASNATKKVAPNLTTFLQLSTQNNGEDGSIDLSATEMIAKAGSLKKLAEKSSTSIHTQNKKNDSLLRRTRLTKGQRSTQDRMRTVQMKSMIDKCALAARVDYFGPQCRGGVDNDDNEMTDEFGKECYRSHRLRIDTWANKKAVEVRVQDKTVLAERAKKFKLKRKQKKKVWRQKKSELKKEVGMGDDMED